MSDNDQEKPVAVEPVADEVQEPNGAEQLEGFGASDIQDEGAENNGEIVQEDGQGQPEGKGSKEDAGSDDGASDLSAEAQEKEVIPFSDPDSTDERVEEVALEQFKAKYGEEYDPFDTSHQVKFMRTLRSVEKLADEKVTQIRRAQENQKTLADSITKALPTPEAQKFADEMFLDLSTRESTKIREAMERGDHGPMVEFCKKAANEYSATPKAKQKVEEIRLRNRNKTPPPPTLEGSGGRGEAGGASDDSMDQLAGFGLS